jgi:FkbM family methyltransferase
MDSAERELSDNCAALAKVAAAGLSRPLRVVDVGAQGIGAHAYGSLTESCKLEIIGFDPLAARLSEREKSEGRGGLTLLPYAIGDGSTRTFYVNNQDATSSFFPLNNTFNACFDRLKELETVHTERIQTRRLDEVLPGGPVDFLSLDVQGCELTVLQGAERTLTSTAVVHCEVEFGPIYLGQPLFCAVHEHLAARRFALIDLLLRYYSYTVPSGCTSLDRLVWADAVYFLGTTDPEAKKIQALVAAAVYHKPNLAEYLLR